jgi:hypothetical protein
MGDIFKSFEEIHKMSKDRHILRIVKKFPWPMCDRVATIMRTRIASKERKTFYILGKSVEPGETWFG